MPRRKKPRLEGSRPTLSLPGTRGANHETTAAAYAKVGALLNEGTETVVAAEPASGPITGATPQDLQPRLANPVPGDDGEALSRIAASFRERFPEDWAAWAKCPTESGIPAMAEKLKGRG